jgi:hypothetical protein
VAQTMEDTGLVPTGRLDTKPLTGEVSPGGGPGRPHAEATSAPATATAPSIHLTRPEVGTLPPDQRTTDPRPSGRAV